MDDFDRLEGIREHTKLSYRSLATFIGLRTPQIFYDIKAGKCGISKDLAARIHTRMPEINPAWLLTGEGEMLRTPAQTQTVVGDGNTQVQGSGNTVAATNSTIDKALDEIKGCHAMLQKSQQQIDRLLGIIETMQQQTAKQKEGETDV